MTCANYKEKVIGNLPNLFIRSAMVLVLLYALLTLILIALTIYTSFTPFHALIIGIAIATLQFLAAPDLTDMVLEGFYKMSWVKYGELPLSLRAFIINTCGDNKMKPPRIGIIHDGAPNAFTYGHTPNNARIVLTRGIMDLLDEDELNGVVAHEIGHARHWDMLIMTAAQIVPLVLYYISRAIERIQASMGGGGDNTAQQENPAAAPLAAISIASLILYMISEYIVLWLSRAREYFADGFAAETTKNPDVLVRGLIKIGYGLAAKEAKQKSNKEDKTKTTPKVVEAVGALGIFDPKGGVALAVSSLSSVSAAEKMGAEIDKENLKAAMKWDLWNPWAKYYEFNSTHPLIANRIRHLGKLSEAMGKEPYIGFDDERPESYRYEFLVDMFIKFLPALVFISLIAASVVTGDRLLLAFGIFSTGIASFIKTKFSYKFGVFPEMSILNLLGKVKVSGVRPVACKVKGVIIGRGIPGLIWSEDFVLQDETGIMFLDYRQPLPFWDMFFGMLKRAKYDNREVEVVGWYRRSPVPRIELKSIKAKGEKERICYTYAAKYVRAGIIAAVGLAFGCYILI